MLNQDLSVYEAPDAVHLFMLFQCFGGDVKRTALVGRQPESVVASLAHDFQWLQKLSSKHSLSTDEGKEFERDVNRVSNYVVATRFKRVLGRLVATLDKDPEFARAFATAVDAEGNTSASMKNFLDLAKAVEVLDNVTYRALQDKDAAKAEVSGNTKLSAEFTVNLYKQLASRFDDMPVVDVARELQNANAPSPLQPETTR
jgi:hypothetical protein